MASPRNAVDYRRLRQSAIVTGIADGVTAVGLPLLAAGLTSNPLEIASVMALQHLPWVIAECVDSGLRRYGDRRTLLGLSNTMRAIVAVVLGALAVANKESLTFVYAGALVIGAGEALMDQAEDESLDAILKADEVPQARSKLRSRGMTGLALLGLPLGGVLYDLASPAPFVMAMVMYAIGALLALRVQTPVGSDIDAHGQEIRAELERLSPLSRTLILIGAVSAGSTSASLGVFVLYATDTLALGARPYGLVLGLFAMGSFLGATVAPWLGERLGIANGIAAALGVGAGSYGLTSMLARQSSLKAIPLLILANSSVMTGGVLLRGMLQITMRSAAERVRTKALRSLHLATWSAIAAGAIVGGFLVKASGFPTLFLLIGGALAVLGALGSTLRSTTTEMTPRVRDTTSW